MKPCPVCGLRYRDFRCGFAFGSAGKGLPAAPNGAKAEAWTIHLETCDDFAADAVAFDVSAIEADPRTSYVPLEREEADPFGGDVDPVAVCLEVAWAAREAMARTILGADWERVCS